MDYKFHYDKLIETRTNRILSDTFYEIHHIVPRSMGGSNEFSNLIKLTPREHFIAHWLLWRIHKNKEMGYAFFCMCNFHKQISSNAYTESKEVFKKFKVRWSKEQQRKAVEIRKLNNSYKRTKEQNRKMIATLKKNKKGVYSDKIRKINSEKFKNLSKEIRQKQVKTRKESNKPWHSDDTKNRIAESHRGLKLSIETRNKIAIHCSKHLKFIDPMNNEFIAIGNMKKFCKENKISYSIISSIINHKRENNYKWKVYVL